MRRVGWFAVVMLSCLAGVSFADKVERTAGLFARSGASSVDEDSLLKVHFIDVGGGDAILIDTPSEKKILIDGGWSFNQRGKASKEYYAYIKHFLGNDIVDLIIISHPDYDHFAGIDSVLSWFTVRQIWYTGYDSDKLSSAWGRLIDHIEGNNDVIFMSPIESFFGLGSVIRFDDSDTDNQDDDVVLTLINAKRVIGSTAFGSGRTIAESVQRNSSSIVVRMDFGETSFLFTGDTNGRKLHSPDDEECEDQEFFMVRNDTSATNPLRGQLDCDVLKVAHHGSSGSSSLPFLRAVTPEWAVICCGTAHGHPHDPVLDKLKHADIGLANNRILRTDAAEESATTATEANLGDDCYIFFMDPAGIVKVEKWSVTVE